MAYQNCTDLRKRNKRGFTLIETMVVVALFTVIGASLMSSFSIGLKVWKSTASTNLFYRKAVLNLERFSRELRQAINYPAVGFYGDQDSIEFPMILQGRVANISYAYQAQQEGIFRSAVNVSGAIESESKSREIISGVKELSFSYYYYDVNSSKYNFIDSWNYTKDGIPLAVKINLLMNEGEAFEKIIKIPIAQ